MSYRVLDKLLSTNNSASIKTVDECIVCLYVKQTRLTFSFSSIKTIGSFDLMYINVWGHYKIGNFMVINTFSLLLMILLE